MFRRVLLRSLSVNVLKQLLFFSISVHNGRTFLLRLTFVSNSHCFLFLSVRFSSQFSQASFLDGADIGGWKGFVQVRNWCRKNCSNYYFIVIVYIIIIAKPFPCYVKFRLGLKMICLIPPGLWRLNMTPPSMVWFFMRLLSARAHPRTKERYVDEKK